MLTPKQRIEAYEYAILAIKENPHRPWMCCLMYDWLRSVNKYVSYLDAGFVELELFTPQPLPFKDTTRWFNPTRQGNNTREIILTLCIEMAKDAKHKKK